MGRGESKNKKVNFLDRAAPLGLYNSSHYKKAPYMQVRIEDGLDKAGDAFAAEILRALQFWHKEPRIVIQLCTGESPFIGYRKIGGDRVLEEKGLYNPRQFSTAFKKYKRIGSVLDTWDKTSTQTFLKSNGLNPKLKPDMGKVIAFGLDAIFPMRSGDYFAFPNLLHNICDLWGIPKRGRHFFYGDVYVVKEGGEWVVSRIPEDEYEQILASINREGLKILEFQAACLMDQDLRGFALNLPLQVKGRKLVGQRLKRDDKGDFRIDKVKVGSLGKSHIQYRFLESMRSQALMMHGKLVGLGGAHICLLGVGPSYAGEGHIGFCEKGTRFEQTCFIGAINDYDATFHIAGAHAKEFYGFKNMFVTVGKARMPRFGFITYGPSEMFYRQYRGREDGRRDLSKEVIVIVIATASPKSSSVARAIEQDRSLQCPLSLTQNYRGVYVLDETSARRLRVMRHPWEFQVFPQGYWMEENIRKSILQIAESEMCKIPQAEFGFLPVDLGSRLPRPNNRIAKKIYRNCKTNFSYLSSALKRLGQPFNQVKQGLVKEILSGLIRPSQIVKKLRKWGIKEGDTVLLVNPHMDDAYLALMYLLRQMSLHYDIHTCFASFGYTAVYSDYILGLLEVAGRLPPSQLHSLDTGLKKRLLTELIKEKACSEKIPYLDYEVFPYMSKGGKLLRAKLLLIDLNERYDLSRNERRLLKNKFRSKKDITQLRDFLAKVEDKKPLGGGQDLKIMRLLKTSARFMESSSGLMSLGIAYENIYWPLDMSFYGVAGRPIAAKNQDIRIIKGMIAKISPKMVIFNGEGFPDYGSHSNTEIGTFISLYELLDEGKISPELVLFQWAGVWDRISLSDSQISLVLTGEELQEFSDSFNYFYPTQAPFAPVLNASSNSPQSFAQDVIANAQTSHKEMVNLLELPGNMKDLLKRGGGILHYKITKLGEKPTRESFIDKKDELERSRLSISLSSNAALCGTAPYPEKLGQLPPALICKMKSKGAISDTEEDLFGYTDTFHLSSQDLIDIAIQFREEMQRGLLGRKSCLAMLPAFVGKPAGEEKGRFLALDLGGSTFRILLVNLAGRGKRPGVIVEKYPLKATDRERKKGLNYDYTRGISDNLFSAIAGCIRSFSERHKIHIGGYKYKRPHPLGFTFSFPVTMTAIDKARLTGWGKEFNIPDLIGKDVVRSLRRAITAEGIDSIVKVVSLNNDTVSTLVTGAYLDKDCDIGGIVGTGTNFAYLESLKNISKLTDKRKAGYGSKIMAVNVESGNFNKVPQNSYDKLLDNASMNKGEHTAEKMVSGLYLGELIRLVIVDLVKKGLLFERGLNKQERAILRRQGSFQTSFMSKILKDDSAALGGVEVQLRQWGLIKKHISRQDKKTVKELCRIVTRRAGRITAATIFAIVTHIDEHIIRRHTVAMDGTLFHKCPFFKDDIRDTLGQLSREVFGDERCDKIVLKACPDSSGVGAAIIAATVVS